MPPQNAAPIPTEEVEYVRKFSFRLIVDGIDPDALKFSSAGSPDSEFSTVEQAEGGRLTNQKRPGKRMFSDVTCRHGESTNRDLWNWHEALGESVSGNGTVPTDVRTVSIVRQRADGTEFGRWVLYQAWPKKYVPGESDAGNDNENVITEVTFAYDHAKWVPA